ncbi:hypothetical protein BKA69DRAFT_1037316 [Paraphysoderma sedebokerense]|nr:hypothetical protein BKA69DRAFT_1037316 [Paraphysoderma sedebokerense]
MDSALARGTRAMLYCIPITVVATMITVPITFLTSKSLSAGLPLAFYIFPFIFASMIAFIVLQVMLYRRLNAFCQSATMKSAEQYGEKIQLGLHSGRSWSWGDSTHYETFEFHDKNGRRICTRQVMVPVFLVPIPNS